jgi:hypothetical protein
MTAFRSLNSGRRTVRLALTVMVFSAVASVARAQAPQAFFERSTVTGSGNTITATNVPVVISGVTVYVNVTMQFNVGSNGNLTLSSGYPQVVAAPNLLSASFMAGTYVGPSSVFNGKAIVTVSGPGVADGGASTWSLSATTGADPCIYPSSATWYVGPIASSPVAARLKTAGTAGITSTAWSYGVASGPFINSFCQTADGKTFNTSLWGPGTLIGVSQSGNAITIASFTDCAGFCKDSNAPVGQITFTLKP